VTYTVEFQGQVNSPARSGCGTSSAGCSVATEDATLSFHFEPTIAEFAKVLMAEYPLPSTPTWIPLAPLRQFTTVGFLAVSLSEGSSPVDVLVGAPPVILGVAGTFPTGFVGGEVFQFVVAQDLGVQVGATTRATVNVAFTSADQTAVQVAQRINAACILAGLPALVSVVGGQIQILGDLPGATESIRTVVANAVIGILSSNRRGSGDPLTVFRNWLLETNAVPGTNFWIRGGAAAVNLLIAGT
jgi:hypothetical protein